MLGKWRNMAKAKGHHAMTRDNLTKGSERIRLGGSDYLWRYGQLLDAKGRLVALRAKSLQMFAVLLAERGRLVSKDRLSDLVWPGVIATDESIARCIADIRKALEDSAHSIVETFPKQGYRLNAEEASLDTPKLLLAHPNRVMAFAAAVCVLAVMAGGWWMYNARDRGNDGTVSTILQAKNLRKAVAILPFATQAAEDRFLAAGLSDDLEIHLAEFSGIFMVSQAQSQLLAGTSENPIELARALDALYLVTGAVRQNADRVSVSLQLIDGSDGTTVWADRYEGSREGILEFRDGLPDALVGAMSIALDSRDRQRLALQETDDPLAFEYVMRARQALSAFSYEGSLAAERHLRRAFGRDPTYARAYAELAAAFVIRLENDWVVLSSADIEKAFFFAEKALELDPDLWLGHYALGRLNSVVPDGNVDEALRHLRTAMSLQPANDDARIYYAIMTTMSGKPKDALPLFENVMAAHPQPPFWYYLGLGNTLFHLRRYDEAEKALSTCLQQMPNSPYCLRTNIAVYARLGRLDDAKWAIEEYEALGYVADLEVMMKITIERDPEMRKHLSESYRMAGLH